MSFKGTWYQRIKVATNKKWDTFLRGDGCYICGKNVTSKIEGELYEGVDWVRERECGQTGDR